MTVQSPCLQIPWTEEPDGLLFMGLQRAGHNWLSTSTVFGVWQALRESQLLKHESTSSWGCCNKCHRLDDFPKRNSFSHSSEDWMFKVPVWQGSVSGESSLPGWQMATFCCVLHGRERERVRHCERGPFIFSWHPDNQKWIMGPHLCPPGGQIWDHHTQFSSVQSLSCVRLFATPWIAARQASLSIINSRSPLRLTSIESGMPSSHLILGRPLLLLSPIPPSIKVFSNESTLCMRWPKYWSLALASFLPKKSQGWSPSEWTGWISLQSKGLSRVFSNTTVQSNNSLALSFLHSPTLTSIHDH